MGLKDITNNNDGGGETSTSSNGSREYERFTKEEFEEFLMGLDPKFKLVKDNDSYEYVYECIDQLTPDNDVRLRVASTVDIRSDKARDDGDDAIRCYLISERFQRVVGGRKKTLRIKTWRKNLAPKINSLVEETSEYATNCDECGAYLVKREGKHGEFLGCINYPDCDHTEQIE